MPQWTPDQERAITTRGGRVVVSAAAGSGKTAVLVERVCHYLVHTGGDLSRLLVVTFTEAAANEMRQRIAATLRQRLVQSPNDRHLERQLVLLQHAHISTIHAFCLWLLRRYFYRLDLDPAFRVMDEGEDRLLKLDVLDALLETRYQTEASGSPFYALVDRYSDEQGEALEQLILRLYDFSQSQVYPLAWLEGMAAAFIIPEDFRIQQLEWYQVVHEHVLAEIHGAKATFQAALRMAQLPSGPGHYVKPLLQDLVLVDELEHYVERGAWDQAVMAFANLKFTAARGNRTGSEMEIDEALRKQVQTLRDGAKKSLAGLAETYFARTESALLQDLRALHTPVNALVELVQEFALVYKDAKAARALVNFADLERLTLQLLLDAESTPDRLQPSVTALEVQTQFDEVLCDEVQDINPVQNAILGLVAGEHNQALFTPHTFMVGDVKQSIYRFRLAEPSIFLQRCQEAVLGLGTAINLAANFRCRSTVVSGVNYLFRALMRPSLGDVEYDQAAELVYQANYPQSSEPEHPVELILLEGDPRLLDDAKRSGVAIPPASIYTQEDEENEESGATSADAEDIDLTALEREAAVVARRIQELVQGKKGPCLIWDKEAQTYRAVRYRDIVVLLRATQVKAGQFVDIFRNEGVPLYAETGTGYFRAPEVETMLALLSIIDNPRQDLSLAGVLRSPIGGLHAAQLADIRLALPTGEFYAAVAARATQNDPLGAKLTAFLTKLDEWRTRARRSTLADLVWSIYRETCFYDYCGGMPGGSQRQANLRALYDRAREFDQFARHGLLRFLQYISDLRAAGEDMGTAPTLGENEDVVRLMSIHKSKGLEFPIVFVAGLGTRFNQKDLQGTFLYDRKLGAGPQIIDPEQRTRAHTLASMGVKESIRKAGLSEEMRILYVALTRARERLYLVGTVSDVETTVERWRQQAQSMEQQRLPFFQVAAAKRYLDWIVPSLCGLGQVVPQCVRDAISTGEQSGWRVTLYPAAVIVQEFREHNAANSDSQGQLQLFPLEQASGIEALPADLRALLHAQLDWVYPWALASTIAARTSVTELKRRSAHFDDPESPASVTYKRATFRRPNFVLEKGKLTAAEIGTATHLVLEHLPLQASVTAEIVATCLADMVNRQILTTEEAMAIDTAAICGFFTEPVGMRMLAAAQTGSQNVLREVPFSLAIPIDEMGGLQAFSSQMHSSTSIPTHTPVQLETQQPSSVSDAVILQGVIDCLFQEPQGWVLLDFKTDRLPESRLEATALQRYAAQVRWYARAATQILGITVNQCCLCLLSHNQVIPVDIASELTNAG